MRISCLVAGGIAWMTLACSQDVILASEILQTPIVFAALSNSEPKFIDSGPLKGTGWVEFETRPILKGLRQDGFKVQVEYMTPARIEHEFRLKNPICTYPVEWMNPKEIFASKPDRIYSIPLDIGGESTSYLIVRNDNLPRFRKHLDSKNSVDILSVLHDESLKTQLIRDKDYGPLTGVITTRDPLGDQIARKEFEKNISLRVLSANQQTLEMLNAKRFDYAFYNDIEAEDFTHSRVDSKGFTLLPFQTGRVKSETDPNLLLVSVVCSDSAVTREAMPYLNQRIRLNRGVLVKNEVLDYRASIDAKASQVQNILSTTADRFRDSFENGALDRWYPLQERYFPGLSSKKDESEIPALQTTVPVRKLKGRWSSFQIEEAGGLAVTVIDRSTGLFTKDKIGANDIQNIMAQLPVESFIKEYLSDEEVRKLEAVSLLNASDDLAFLEKTSAGRIKKLTLFGDLSQETLALLKPHASGLLNLRAFGAGEQTTRELISILPPSLKHLNLTGSIVSGSELALQVKKMDLLSLHLNHSSLLPEQLKTLLPSLGNVEHLSLGMLRTSWNDGSAEVFSQVPFKKLKSLDLQNCALSDSQARLMTQSLPPTLEALNLGANFLSLKGLAGVFDRSLPKLTSLNLSNSLLGFSGATRVKIPQSVRYLFLRNAGLSDRVLNSLSLPKQLLSLDVTSNKLGDDSLLALTSGLSDEIEQFQVGSTSFSEKGLLQLMERLQSRKIRSLNLSFLRVADAPIERLMAKPPIGLEELDLSGNRISNRGATALAKGVVQNLVQLKLAGNPLSGEGVVELGKHFSSKLRWLDLSNILDLPLADLAPLLPMELKNLVLNNNQISDAELSVLARFFPKELRGLHLARAAFSDRGVRVLAASLPEYIEDLDLSRNPIGETGMLVIARALPASIRSFRLGEGEFSVGGARKFMDALPRTLRSLWLQGIATTPLGILEIFQNLPPHLEQLRFYGSPHVEVAARGSIGWPKTLREIYLQGVLFLNSAVTIDWMSQLPSSLNRLALFGAGLDNQGLDAAVKRDLKNLHTLQLRKTRLSLSNLNRALTAFGSLRFFQMAGNQASVEPGAKAFTKNALQSVKVFSIPQNVLPAFQLRSLLIALPLGLWDLNLSANQIQSEQIETLLKLMPKNLHVLAIHGNDLGMKGFQRLEEYKREKEGREDIPFDLLK